MAGSGAGPRPPVKLTLRSSFDLLIEANEFEVLKRIAARRGDPIDEVLRGVLREALERFGKRLSKAR